MIASANRVAVSLLAGVALCACGDDGGGNNDGAGTDAGVNTDVGSGADAEFDSSEEGENPFGPDYFGGDGYVEPNTHANVVRALSFAGDISNGVALGFDLDGRVSDPGESESCGWGDKVDSDGNSGIDNQFGSLWPLIEPTIGTQVEALLQGAINEGSVLIIVELGGVDDLMNDDEVEIRVFRGSADPDVGNQGLLAPSQTYQFNYDTPYSASPPTSIVDGVVQAEGLEFYVPIDILDANFNAHITYGVVRLEIQPDGTFRGVIGGAINVDDFLYEILNTGARAEAEAVQPIIENNADMVRVDGECTLLSVAFEFDATTAFVVREPGRELPTEDPLEE